MHFKCAEQLRDTKSLSSETRRSCPMCRALIAARNAKEAVPTGKIKSPTGGLQVFWTDGTSDSVVGYNTPKDRWFHYSATYDGVGLIVFINGKKTLKTGLKNQLHHWSLVGFHQFIQELKIPFNYIQEKISSLHHFYPPQTAYN